MAHPLKKKKKRFAAFDDEDKEHLAYLGTLSGGLAHSIKTPLQSIIMNLELMEEDLKDTPQESVNISLSRVKRETRHLQEILEEFLSFARPPKMDLLPIDLNEYLSELVEFVEPECTASGIEIITEYDEELYPVLLDRYQFSQIFLNLVINAKEAFEESGEGTGGRIVIRTKQDDENILIEVQDNAGGVPLDKEDEIFQAFKSNKSGGSGLGLCIAQRIAYEHGGEITLQNKFGQGATFVVRLPKGIFLGYAED